MSVRAKIGISVILFAGLAVLSGLGGYMMSKEAEQTHSFVCIFLCTSLSIIMALSVCMACNGTYRFLFWNSPNRKI